MIREGSMEAGASPTPASSPVAVFGATGFIGKRFCELSRRPTLAVERERRDAPAEELLYLISTTDNYNVLEDVHKDVKVNIEILLDVLKELPRPDGAINFISSWFVYGDVPLPATEDGPCNPKGFYSITKRAAEQLLISYCETFGIRYRIFRLCNVYGAGDRGVSKRKNALQYLLREIQQGHDINLYHGGEFQRDYMHVDDVVRAIDLCMASAPWNSIVNIGSGAAVRFRDLMELARETCESRSQFLTVEPPKFHGVVQVKDFFMDTSKLRGLGFRPQIQLEEGIRQLCRV